MESVAEDIHEVTPFTQSEPFKRLYTEKEQQFLKDFFAKHAHDEYAVIEQNFAKFAQMDSQERLKESLAALHHTDREAWNIVLAEPVQSVGQHVDNMRKEARQFSFGDEKGLTTMIKIHDIAEAIATDIPNLPETSAYRLISSEDKQQMELLAGKLILEDHPKLYDVFTEYESKQSRNAVLTKVIDLVELLKSTVTQLDADARKDKKFIVNKVKNSTLERLKETLTKPPLKDGEPEEVMAYVDQIIANGNGKQTERSA